MNIINKTLYWTTVQNKNILHYISLYFIVINIQVVDCIFIIVWKKWVYPKMDKFCIPLPPFAKFNYPNLYFSILFIYSSPKNVIPVS